MRAMERSSSTSRIVGPDPSLTVHRQREPEPGSVARHVAGADAPAVGLDDRFADRQPHAAGGAAGSSAERLEDPVHIADPRAVVLHPYLHLVVGAPRADLDRASRRRVASGILHQVRDNLIKLAVVAI